MTDPNQNHAGDNYPPPPHYYNTAQILHADPVVAQRVALIRLLLRILITSAIIIFTLIFLTWIIIQPRFPAFQINSISVTNINFSSSPPAFTGVFDVNFTVTNPNKKVALVYENITADVYYQNSFLTESALQPFVQPKHNVTVMRGMFSALTAYLNKDAMDETNKERGDGGHVPFNLRMVMRIAFNAGSWRIREGFIRVFCGDLVVAIHSNAPNGTMIGGPQVCKVGI